MSDGPKLESALESHQEIDEKPPAEWLIDGILPKNSLAALYGEPATYKTFVAISMAASVATGRGWNGREVKQGKVAYVIAEGTGGFAKRLNAWSEFSKVDDFYLPREDFGTISRPVDLLEESTVQWLIDNITAYFGGEVPENLLIVIDTVARCFGGGDENSTQDMGQFIKNVDLLKIGLNATILLVHHSGKDVTRGARGSSALRGALDVEIVSTRTDKFTTLKCEKQKDAEEFEPLPLGVIKVGASLVITNHQNVPFLKRKPGQAQRPKLKKSAWDVLQAIIGAGAVGIHVDQIVHDTQQSIRSVNRHLDWLERHGVYTTNGLSGKEALYVVNMEEALLFEKNS